MTTLNTQGILYKLGLLETVCFACTDKTYWWFIEDNRLIMSCWDYSYGNKNDWTMIDSFGADSFLN